jgi:hypothetical protein
MSLNYLLTREQAMNYLYKDQNMLNSHDHQKRVDQYIATAHKSICSYLGYEILSKEYIDELYDGGGSSIIYLNNRPINAITSIKEDNNEINDSVLIRDGVYIEREDFIFSTYYRYKITYTAGWTSTTMPEDIRYAALQLVGIMSQEDGVKSGGGLLGVTSISKGDTSKTLDFTQAKKDILATLSSYRRMGW